jgi:type IV pilus assembly protein PilA
MPNQIAFRMKLPRTSQEGFTLIELVVVTLIIGILASIALMQFLSYRERGYNATLQSDLRSAYTASKQFYMDHPNGVFKNADLENEDYGYRPSKNVKLHVDNGDEANLLITASYLPGTGTPNIYQVDHAGRVSKR